MAPAMSRRAAVEGPRPGGSRMRESATTAIPTGRLTRKTQCQLSAFVRTPPSSTPMLPPPAATKPKNPIAFARSAGSVNRFMISEPTAKQQEAAEGEEIGVYHPGKRGLGETKILPDRRERDVHNCRVEHDHQSAQAEDDQREPAPRASPGGRCEFISERFSMTQSICFYEFHSIAPLNLRCVTPGT